jgi:hypothetical protein
MRSVRACLGLVAVAGLLAFVAALPAHAGVPPIMNFQGILLDANDMPVKDSSWQVAFRIFNAGAAGGLFWDETQTVTTKNGLFSTFLGQAEPIPDSVFSIFGGPDRWLEMQLVANPTPYEPRTRIGSVGYAYRVNSVDGAGGGAIGGDVAIFGRASVGDLHTNTGDFGFAAGLQNWVIGPTASVSGGYHNYAEGSNSHIGGGISNIATGSVSAVGGGGANEAGNEGATVGGGGHNQAAGNYATVAGGANNLADAEYAMVAGGNANHASTSAAAVGGGLGNNALGLYAVVSGGRGNTASAENAAVGGGNGNWAPGGGAVVAGGVNNRAGGMASVVAGGGGELPDSNAAWGDWSAVGGGRGNAAAGLHGTVAGGRRNVAWGDCATIPGGMNNSAVENYTFAAGYRAKANHDGAFVWADWNDFDFSSSASNEFSARCTGGARFVSGISEVGNPTTGVQLAPGDGSWSSISDRNLKEELAPVDGASLLARLAAIPIETWKYKSQAATIRHIGPMAQDFRAAFGVGQDSTHITTIDADGVSLAAIQELYRTAVSQQAENAALRAHVDQLQRLLDRLLATQHLDPAAILQSASDQGR